MGWVSYTDPGSGEPYFHNTDTGVTQWEVPDGFAIDEEGGLVDLSDPAQNAGDEGPRCWMDVAVGGEAPRRIVFRLFPGRVPKTADNFRALCTGEAGTALVSKKVLHYKGTRFHRIVPGFMCQGGDITSGDGTGGESIYGGSFEDEWLGGKHSRPFLLSMANSGPNTNSSQFFITTAAAPHLDGKHVIFGEVLRGEDTVRRMEAAGSLGGKPSVAVKIVDCGEGEPEGGGGDKGNAAAADSGSNAASGDGAASGDTAATAAATTAAPAATQPAAALAGPESSAPAHSQPALSADAASVQAAQPWQRHWDPSSGQPYYHHVPSGATTWERPQGYLEADEIERAVELASRAAEAAGVAGAAAGSAATAPAPHTAAAPAPTQVMHAPSAPAAGVGIVGGGRDEAGFLTADAAARAAEALKAGVDPRELLAAGASALAAGEGLPGAPGAPAQGMGGDAYVSRASFRPGGKFEHAGHASYWDKKGIPGDREARQLSHFMNLDSLSSGQGRKRQRAPDWRERKKRADEAKAKKRKAWLYE